VNEVGIAPVLWTPPFYVMIACTDIGGFSASLVSRLYKVQGYLCSREVFESYMEVLIPAGISSLVVCMNPLRCFPNCVLWLSLTSCVLCTRRIERVKILSVTNGRGEKGSLPRDLAGAIK
jgi:hypothetical protein